MAVIDPPRVRVPEAPSTIETIRRRAPGTIPAAIALWVIVIPMICLILSLIGG